MHVTGILHKMQTEHTTPVSYHLTLTHQVIELNTLIGQPVTLHHTGAIYCIHCGRKTSKSFDQGYCYPCFQRLAQCDTCIVKPELCHYAQGTCREPEWGEQHCMQPHYVYLANSSSLKVGITRHTQIPTRWIDQGATQALTVFRVSTRYYSGLVEVVFKDHVNDKTSWQKMLKGEPEPLDLSVQRAELLKLTNSALQPLQERLAADLSPLTDATTISITYPVEHYPSKVTALNLDKNPTVKGILQGIKGQYWLLDTGVLNIRKFGGYHVTIESPDN